MVELGGLHIYMIHDVNALDLNPKAAGFAAVISGHSHQPKQEMKDGVLYFNPGSAGPRRFKLPMCVGRMEIVDGKVRRGDCGDSFVEVRLRINANKSRIRIKDYCLIRGFANE